MSPAPPILEARGLVKRFSPRGGPWWRATSLASVAGVDLYLRPGEVLGLVGESGCGKSTLARMLVALERPSAGDVRFRGRSLFAMSRGELRRARRELQIVFQDPLSALNPRMTIEAILSEPLRIHGEWSPASGPVRVRALLERVGLSRERARRLPHECSGGERQRVGLARALAVGPDVLILDEPVSALDVSIGAGIVNLLADLRAELGLAYLFIAHDLAVVRQISDRVAVMHGGAIVESGPCAAIYERPRHPFTAALLSAVPASDPVRERTRPRIVLAGEPPSPMRPPSGCRFHPRCWRRAALEDDGVDVAACETETPALTARDGSAGELVACHFPVGARDE